MNTITRRVVTILAGPAITTGFLAAGIIAGAPAQAKAQTVKQPTCITSPVVGPTPNTQNPLTRAAQVNAIQPATHVFSPAVSCIGH